METKAQKSELKMSKSKAKCAAKHASVRVKAASKKVALALRDEANNKPSGRKVKLDDIFELALNLVTSEHLKALQEQSLTNEDRKELLRQKYIETHGPISRDQFTGLMMSAEFATFLTEQNQAQKVSQFVQTPRTGVAS